MTKKYTLAEFKELYDVASKAVKEDIKGTFDEAVEIFAPDPDFAEATSRLLKTEADLITKRIEQYMFDSLEDEEE